MGEIFQFMVFTFPEDALNLCIFTHVSVPHSKLQVELFENLFPQEERGGGNYVICFFKIQTENMKMTWNISFYLYFV